jgi:hypothetical protein
LVVDADAVGTGAVSLQLLQPVPGRNTKIAESVSGVEDEELAQGSALGLLIKPFRSSSLPDPFGVLVPEGLQHLVSITDTVMNGKRYGAGRR